MDYVGMAGYLIGTFVAGLFWFSLIAVIANLAMIKIADKERRAEWFLTGGLAFVGIGGTLQGFWFQALAMVPPILAVWFGYRTIARRSKRLNARPTYPDKQQ